MKNSWLKVRLRLKMKNLIFEVLLQIELRENPAVHKANSK
jgi:hypothetical protein